MLKNKKSLAPEALVRTIIAVAIVLLIVFPLADKLHSVFFGNIKKYDESFDKFVNEINAMGQGRETLQMAMKDTSAIIGFSKNAERFECFNCYVGIQNRPTIIYDKPKNSECAGKACICLCQEGFKLEEVTNGTFGVVTKYGKCSQLVCKSVSLDISERAPVKLYPGIDVWFTTLGGGTEYWKNGFLYLRGVSGANGLKLYNEEYNNFIVERSGNTIGVCNSDIMQFNAESLGFDKCIITALDEAKKLEERNIDAAASKYLEIISNSAKDDEIKAAFWRLILIYIIKKDAANAEDMYNRMIAKFPESSDEGLKRQILQIKK